MGQGRSTLGVYSFLKWNDFLLQFHYLKRLSRSTFSKKCPGSGTMMEQARQADAAGRLT
jgi:hypothetical protein